MVSDIHQHESATSIPMSPPSLPISLPIPPLWVVTEHSFGFPASYSKLPLAIYFISGNVYVSMLSFQTIPSSPSPSVSKSLFLCLCLLCCLQVGFCRYHKCVLIYNICLLSDFTLYNRL